MADDYTGFREAYDKTTGEKVGLVPAQWFDIFPNLRKTPKTKAAEKQAEESTAIKADSTKEGKK